MAFKTFTGASDSNFYKFDTIGKTLVGTWQGTEISNFKKQDGSVRYNILVIPDGVEEPVKIDVTGGIEACFEEAFGGMEHCPVGTKIMLKFVKQLPPKPGQKGYKIFELSVDEDDLPSDEVGF